MKCFDTYYSRFKVATPYIEEPAPFNLHTIVVIPCFNEPDIATSLFSLLNCTPTMYPVEIIVVVNSPENSPESVVSANNKTLLQIDEIARNNSRSDIKIYSIYCPNLPKKHAGVGFARKIGMDEAIHRFDSIGNKDGVVVNFDADSTCNYQYLSAIESYFFKNPKIEGASIYFEHPLQGNNFDSQTYNAIAKYELYLRYFVEIQRYIGFPFAYHTIGSAFAVRASVYAAEGGMNRRQAGEDFYFLQKIISRQHYGEIMDAVVYPSPRISTRVPFGTGAAIFKLCNDNSEYLVYNPLAFDILKTFFSTAIDIRQNIKPQIHPFLEEFLLSNDFFNQTSGMAANSTSEKTFMLRFFAWFDAFRIIKFLNFVHEKYIEKVTVEQAAIWLANKIGMPNMPSNAQLLLKAYRKFELMH